MREKSAAGYGVLTRRLVAFWLGGLVLVLGGISAIVGRFAAREEAGAFDWELAAIVGTALGTSALAAVTGALAYSTSGDVRATWELARLTQEDQAAREQPIVVTRGYMWEDAPDNEKQEVSGRIEVGIINIGLGPALDVVIEARFGTPASGKRLEPEPKEVWGGILRVMLPGERFTFRLPVVFAGKTPDWVRYAGMDVRATFTDRTRNRRYDLEGNEVSDMERILWTPYGTPFVGAEEGR